MEILYIESIIPLVGATFTPTNKTSANEKVVEIMMFSFEHNDYYQVGAFNFNSCAVRSTAISGVVKRSASTINSENPALDSIAVHLSEFDSDCEGKDPSYVLPRAKNCEIAEYEEWDEDLFRHN